MVSRVIFLVGYFKVCQTRIQIMSKQDYRCLDFLRTQASMGSPFSLPGIGIPLNPSTTTPTQPAFVSSPVNPSSSTSFFLPLLHAEPCRASGTAWRLRVIARGDLLLRNNVLPLLGNAGSINRLTITGLLPHRRPHFCILLGNYLGNSFVCQ